MFWTVTSFQPCRFHVFLSHTSKHDKDWLVEPLDGRLRRRGIIPWFDKRAFPIASDGFEVLRNGLLYSRHVVYLVTKSTLDSRRGWQLLERCYGSILQDALSLHGLKLAHVELPLFFFDYDDPQALDELNRSIWQPLVRRDRFCPVDGAADAVSWAFDQIERFVLQEQEYSDRLLADFRNDPHLLAYLSGRPDLARRISADEPSRVT